MCVVTKDVPSGETIQAMLVTRVKREGTDKEIGKERLDAPGCPTLSISAVWVACRTSQIPLLFVTRTALMNAGMVSVTSPLEKGSPRQAAIAVTPNPADHTVSTRS